MKKTWHQRDGTVEMTIATTAQKPTIAMAIEGTMKQTATTMPQLIT